MSDLTFDPQKGDRYRLQELERKLKGVQREQTYLRAVQEREMKDALRRIRDLELRDARNRRVPVSVISTVTGLSRSSIYRVTGVSRMR